MKRNNGSENNADGPKETFRSWRHQRHQRDPEAHINLPGKQQGLDTGSKQSGSHPWEEWCAASSQLQKMGFGGGTQEVQWEFTSLISYHTVNHPPPLRPSRPLLTVHSQKTNYQTPCSTTSNPNQLHQPSSTGTQSINNMSHMSCQIHATRSVQDSWTKKYCPVATVTPFMQKTPCRSLKNGDLWDFILKAIPVTVERSKEG